MRKKEKCIVDGCNTLTNGIEGYCTKHREFSISRRYKRLKQSAMEKHIPIDISLYDYEQLLISNSCEYCNGPLPKAGHGLDRIDSSKGYTRDNVAPCCNTCNMTKSNVYTYSQMKIIAEFINEMKLTNWRVAKKEK